MKDAKADDIHGKIIKFFKTYNIPYKKNLIGFASDGANVMAGQNNSVMTKLKAENKSIFLMKCICHSFNLCTNYACKKLSRWVEDLARDVHNYIAGSPKRTAFYQEFQKFTETAVHKILYPVQTRWLSLESVVLRLLEQYDALKLYFMDAVVNDRLLAAETILQKLHDPLSKLFLQFLKFILPIFNNLNREMQSTSPQIYHLRTKIVGVYKTILECFIRRDLILNCAIEKIDYKNPHNFLKLEDIYVGAENSAFLSRPDNGITKEQEVFFRTRCLHFLIESIDQINIRFDFANDVLLKLELINPENVKKGSSASIIPLAMHFPNLLTEKDYQKLDSEWRLLRNTEIQNFSDNGEEFWVSVLKEKYNDGTSMFGTVSKFAIQLLSLPHSSANVERLFSQINLIKTNSRNLISSASLSGLLHTKEYLNGKSCYNLPISKELLKLHSNKMYKKDKDCEILTDSETSETDD